MTTDNHAEFARQVLRGVAHLYADHPRTGTLSSDIVLKGSPPPAKQEEIEAACGTVLWLYRNNIITGDVQDTALPRVTGAQLTASAYAILHRVDQNASGGTLGELAVRAASDFGSHNERVISELIVRRLSV